MSDKETTTWWHEFYFTGSDPEYGSDAYDRIIDVADDEGFNFEGGWSTGDPDEDPTGVKLEKAEQQAQRYREAIARVREYAVRFHFGSVVDLIDTELEALNRVDVAQEER